MHGLCTDVCIHLCFSGQQQQYECRLDSTIKNCSQIYCIILKENASPLLHFAVKVKNSLGQSLTTSPFPSSFTKLLFDLPSHSYLGAALMLWILNS